MFFGHLILDSIPVIVMYTKGRRHYAYTKTFEKIPNMGGWVEKEQKIIPQSGICPALCAKRRRENFLGGGGGG